MSLFVAELEEFKVVISGKGLMNIRLFSARYNLIMIMTLVMKCVVCVEEASPSVHTFFNPLPHTPILGSSNSAANKDMMSKI